jgi:asparagine synthase (glutamine-hydrolysing)
MRERLLEILDRQADSPSAAVPVSPASRGLEFTMPFHDKRIVEFGLAIPERLYARGGRDRYLAHLALGDILPPEFKTRRWGGNDTLDPDVDRMVDSITGELLGAVDSMAEDERLSGYLDFAKIRQGLSTERENGDLAHIRALRALLLGYYLRWADRRNRP